MKTAIGAVVAAIGASACCLGPVVFAAIGSGALAAASTKLEPVRPVCLALTFVLLGGAFYGTYGRPAKNAACDDACTSRHSRRARVGLWIMTVLVLLLAAFPYYAEYLF